MPDPIGPKQWLTVNKRLIGHGFPAQPTPAVPKSIRATPKVLCPQCGELPVLHELRFITKGLCFQCHQKTRTQPAK